MQHRFCRVERAYDRRCAMVGVCFTKRRELLPGLQAAVTARLPIGTHAYGNRGRQLKADHAFRWNRDLLATRDCVRSGTDASTGGGSNGRSFASAEDAPENGSDRCSPAGLFGCVHTSALAFERVRIRRDRQPLPPPRYAVERDGK
jgi:hypothetical protein